MFENFVLGKIKKENEVINENWQTILSGEEDLKEWIVKSSLSDFTKNYIINDYEDKIDREELLSRIEKANKLYFNYALRPKWTLLTFLFNNFESRPPNEIIKKLNLFPFYNFYGEAITGFIKGNFQIFCTKTEIASIIDEANKAVHEKLSEDTNNSKIKNFFLQIFKLKYADESGYGLESTVPYAFIKIFLDDKGYADFRKKFTVIKDLKDDTEVSLKDIIKVLTGKYNLPETEEVKKPESTNISISPEVTIPKEQEKNKIAVPLKKEIPEKKIIEKKPDEIKQPEKIYSEQLIKAAEEKKPEENKADSLKVSEDRNVKELFNEKQLEKIADRIYNSDLIYRDKSFNKLNNYKTWFEVSNHLKEIFKVNNVDIYNKDVISFIDTLNDYYKNRE